MSKTMEKTRMPKLRFSEFLDAGAWDEKRLGNEGELFSSLTGKSGADFDTGEARFVTYMNVFSNTFVDSKALRFVDVQAGESQNAVVSGDVFFTISSETPDEVGMSSVLLEKLENCYLNSFCALFRFSKNKRPNPVFTGYLLRQPLVRAYFTKKAQGSTRFNLSKDSFRSLPLFVPSLLEQQKIADCLSSIDELIALQAQKLEALKTHKKGLMQQLFPREGETIPRLRFPEFRDAVAWEEKNIGHISENVTSGGTPSTSEKSYWGGSIRWMNSGELNHKKVHEVQGRITDEGLKNSSTKIIPKMCVLIGLAGQGKTRGTVAINMLELCINQSIAAIFPNHKKFSSDFLYHNLDGRYDELRSLSAGGEGRGGLNLQIINSMVVPLPCIKEQQRIADCLSSIDELIALQAQKLEALKTHKKGLMQQLFPVGDEVGA
jgi:type I restriction enzyme, S subunit